MKKILAGATKSLNILLRDAREMVRANLAVAAMIHQPNSDAVSLLGGKPRRGGRRPAAKQPAPTYLRRLSLELNDAGRQATLVWNCRDWKAATA